MPNSPLTPKGTELGLEEKRSYRVQVITGANLSGKSAPGREQCGWHARRESHLFVLLATVLY